MIRSRALAAAVAALTLPATACGGSNPSTDVRRAFERFFADLGAGDGQRACAFLTERAREQFVALALEPELGCERSVETESRSMPELNAALKRVRVTAAKVDGDRAQVRDQDVEIPMPAMRMSDGNGRPFVLVRRDGRWLLEDLG